MATRAGPPSAPSRPDRRHALARGCALAGAAAGLGLGGSPAGAARDAARDSARDAARDTPTGEVSLPTAASASGPLRLRSAAQAGAPAKYGSGDPRRPGLCGEIVAAVMRIDPGLRIEGLDQAVPLRRLELMLSAGELDVFFCLLKSEHRHPLMRYLPVPLYRIAHVLAMRSDDERVPRSWDELRAFARRHPLLLAQGTKLASTLQVADVAFQDTARSDREALQMLVKGRTAAVYGQDVNLREAARGAGLEGQARIGPQVFEEETQYAVVSRRLPEPVVERLTERLRQLSASGEIARLAERYR